MSRVDCTYISRELGSAPKSLSQFLVAVTVWIASLLSITLFQIDLGLGLQLAMEIGMDKLFDLTGMVSIRCCGALVACRSMQ